MAWLIIAFDGTDAEAPARRAAARDEHVAVITAEAEAGRLALGLPLHDEAGNSLGSVMVLDTDKAGLDAYLGKEPFARRGVWQRIDTHSFRIAPLPYAGWPQAAAGGRSHTVTMARDGQDPAAQDRRLAARPGHFARVRQYAEDGTLLMGGAILDAPEGKMVGSVAVTRHPTHAEAEAFWREDPYVQSGVWLDLRYYATSFRPLPYKPLPAA
ncbi:YciI family protein [Roseomonas sp. AR75]|uniref:YciI family protein n=1 Tax=Roseomonas sp. AR75 TaxID=2562311 RepID=UPI0010BFAC03|nr:YciI family protein [Roseomonas sp. AR75]